MNLSVWLFGVFSLLSFTAFGYPCRTRPIASVSCVVSSQDVWSTLDRGSFRLDYGVLEQDPTSSRQCPSIAQDSSTADAVIGIRGKVVSTAEAGAYELSADKQRKTLAFSKLSGAGALFLGYDDHLSQIFLGNITSISGAFSYERPSVQQIEIGIDGVKLKAIARCIPQAVYLYEELNDCIHKLQNQEDTLLIDQKCAQTVYENHGGT